MKKIVQRILRALKRGNENNADIGRYRFPEDADVAGDLRERYQYSGDLLDIYTAPRKHIAHKWHHYLPIYDRHFASWRGRPLRFLEIGVSKGGSLEIWRSYFGESAIIFGIDFDENCRQLDGAHASVRIGSQADASFLADVVAEMGGVDIILDDGSHKMDHIRASLECLFPLLSEGGLYVIEDLHTAYWRDWGGGYRKRGNFFNYVRDMIDDMHSSYHNHGSTRAIVSDNCSAIHIFDSICILEKNEKREPAHSSLPRDR